MTTDYIINQMEVYAKIKGFENYAISNGGIVINIKTGKEIKQRTNKYGYKRVNLYANSKMKVVNTHKIVANAYLDKIENKNSIDHINGDKTDNRVSNLRYCNASENMRNSAISSRNKSGIRGVNFHKKTGKYRASICHNNKSIHIGYYDNCEDAKNARQLKANQLFGEFIHQSEKLV